MPALLAEGLSRALVTIEIDDFMLLVSYVRSPSSRPVSKFGEGSSWSFLSFTFAGLVDDDIFGSVGRQSTDSNVLDGVS